MKELSIEEKAKRYDEAIKKAKSKIKNNKDHVLYEDDIIEIFPELIENESEKIRKALLKFVHDTPNDDLWIDYDVHKEDTLAWLEKQKDVNSVEYIFRPIAGCNIVDAAAKAIEQQKLGNKIVLVFNDAYIPVEEKTADDIVNEYYSWLKKQVGQEITDDEDILQRFSFYTYKDEPNILYLAALYVNDKYRNKGIGTKILDIADEVAKSLNCHAIRLKTKKGSNAERLYQAHGYNSLANEGKGEIWLEKQGELDDNIITRDNEILQAISVGLSDILEDAGWSDFGGLPIEEIQDWIKNHGGFDETKAKMFLINKGYPIDANGIFPTYEEMYDIIKKGLEKQSNNNQYWKPSKEQINALEHFVRNIAESGYASPYDNNTKLLMSLINDLYKLLENQSGQKPIDFKAENFYVSKVDGKIHDMTYNPADKVESKFKVGDWVVNNEDGTVGQITNIYRYWDGSYGYDHTNGCFHGKFEEVYHLWTIADAKNGDILTGKIDGDTYILIYKQTTDGWIETYGHYYNAVNRFGAPSLLFCRDYQGTFTPATKEQRDTLEKAMADAGREFDFEKKELKKIEQKSAKWSEEDECYLTGVTAEIMANQHEAPCDTKIYDEYLNWLASIKRRMQ